MRSFVALFAVVSISLALGSCGSDGATVGTDAGVDAVKDIAVPDSGGADLSPPPSDPGPMEIASEGTTGDAPQEDEGSGDVAEEAGEDPGGPSPCTENIQCSEKEYCAKDTGDCEGKGKCTPRPIGCTKVYDPVCGCDGKTYGNPCEAASSGINVKHKGECVEPFCTKNEECKESDYCEKVNCDGKGTCVVMPEFCTKVWAPVCGCDGITYGNECLAAASGVNVDFEGECSPDGCKSNGDCILENYCLKEGCTDVSGTCEPKPTVCPFVWAPVCGCDGKTYGNACEAASVGVNMDYLGECGEAFCTANVDCKKDSFCEKESCDGKGQCAPKPTMCPAVWMPVCGCDGKTYGNSCEAAAAGMNVDPKGDCLIPIE